MQRRSVLRGLFALTTGAIAGCLGAEGEVPAVAPEPPFEVEIADDGESGTDGDGSNGSDENETPDRQRFRVPDRTFEAADDGHLVVVVTVENRSDAPHEAVLTAEVTAGRKVFTPSEFVSLLSGERREVRFHVPVPYGEFQADPGFGVQLDPGRPSTPLPDGTVTPYPEDRATGTSGSADSTESGSTGTATTG